MSRRHVLLLALSGLTACHPDPAADADAPRLADPDGATLEVGADGALTWTDADGAARTVRIELGFVDDPDEAVNYDPYLLKDPEQADAVPYGLVWAQPTSAAWTGAAYTLGLDTGATATLTVDATGPGLRLAVRQAEGAEWAPYVRVTVPVDSAEGLYGLGEQLSGVEHRGQVIAMQFELWTDMESANNEAHVPVPLLVSSAGWGLLADSLRPGVFDVAAAAPDAVEVTYDTAPGEGFAFDLYAPGTGAQVTARYHARTGYPEVPPTWAFAPMQWQNEVDGADDVRADMRAIRENGVPTGLIWVDNPWQTTYNSMTADPAMFPDWDGLVQELHDGGFRAMAWSTPYLEEDDPDHDLYAANGWFVDAAVLLNPFGDWVDLTSDGAMAAWQARVSAARDHGLEGWKLDYGEDTQLGIGATRLHYDFENGADERTMHHAYTTYYHHAYADPYPVEADGTRAGFLLGRAGVLGGHTVTDCIWPGDLDNDFAVFSRADGTVGGLPSAIRAGTGLAASGYPFFASDTGGYRGGRPSAEVMVRWTEYAATLPIFQYGGAGANHNPWDYASYDDDGPSQFTPDTLADFTRYAVLHIRLFPYFWELAQRARAEGLPTVQALGLAYPALGVHPQDAYLVGADLYVAPVEAEGATTRTLTLPPGTWVHWWTGEAFEGPGTITVDAPLGQGPLFQRGGSAIPMLRRSVMTLSPSDGSVDSWADDAGRLNARVVPGDGAAFALGTGEALNAERAQDILLTPGTRYAGWDIEVHAPGATGAEVDGQALPVGVDGCTACVILDPPWVRVVTDGARVSITGGAR